MNELNAALYSRLSGGTALTGLLGGTAIYHAQAPDENQTANRTKNALVYVRAYANKAATAGSIDAAADALLHDSPLTVTGYTNFWIRRDGDVELIENTPNGAKIYSSGATYRVRLDKN